MIKSAIKLQFSSLFYVQVQFIRSLMKWPEREMDCRKTEFPAPIESSFRPFRDRKKERRETGRKKRCVNLLSYYNSSVRRYLNERVKVNAPSHSIWFCVHFLRTFIIQIMNSDVYCYVYPILEFYWYTNRLLLRLPELKSICRSLTEFYVL